MIYLVIGLLLFIIAFGIYADNKIKELEADNRFLQHEEEYSTNRMIKLTEENTELKVLVDVTLYFNKELLRKNKEYTECQKNFMDYIDAHLAEELERTNG